MRLRLRIDERDLVPLIPAAMESCSARFAKDLVSAITDHRCRAVRSIDAVAVVDTNDPALVLAWSRGLKSCDLCDDNRPLLRTTH